MNSNYFKKIERKKVRKKKRERKKERKKERTADGHWTVYHLLPELSGQYM